MWLAIKKLNLSVRQTEELARRIQETAKQKTKGLKLSADWMDIQDELQRLIGVMVKIRPTAKEKGKIELHYSSRDDMDRIVETLFFQAELKGGARPIGGSLL